MRKFPALLSAVLLVGCTGILPASLKKGACLILTPQIQAGNYQTQATVSVYTSASIDHLTIKLLEGTTEIASKTISQSDLVKPITFSNLRANTTYTVKSYAYLANNAQISLDGGSSRVFTTLTDDRPNILSLPVLLSDIPFNGIGTSSIQVANGGYSFAASESLGILLRGTVNVNLEGRGDSFKARLFSSTGAEVATAMSTSANPIFTFNELSENSNYNVWVEAYKSSVLFASQSVALNLGSDNLSVPLSLKVPYLVSTLAGVAKSSGSADGTGTEAKFSNPNGVAVDGSGNVYVADRSNYLIRRIDAQSGYVSTVAGIAGSSGFAEGTGTAARLSYPQAVAVDGAGNVYVADTYNHVIRRIDAQSGYVSTIAGVAKSPGTADGIGTVAKFNNPSGVALDKSGNVYVADSGNHLIRRIDAQSNYVSTLAGVAGSASFADGEGISAKFNSPRSVAVDAAGNVYVADNTNHLIRRIDAQSNYVSTVAGITGSYGTVNGTGTMAQFYFPNGVVVDGVGNIYVADYSNHLIRRIDAQSNYVSTVAGVAKSYGTADGIGTAAKFYNPYGIALDGAGNLYVADYNNHLIRVLR